MFIRIVDGIKLIAGVSMIFVTLFVFVSVLGRYFFNAPIPETNDLGRLVLGIAMMFGIAIGFLDGKHITMDTFWLSLGKKGKAVLDVFAAVTTLVAVGVMSWMMFERTMDTYRAGEATFDLRWPIWMFYSGAVLGAVCATFFAAVFLYKVIKKRNPRHSSELEEI